MKKKIKNVPRCLWLSVLLVYLMGVPMPKLQAQEIIEGSKTLCPLDVMQVSLLDFPEDIFLNNEPFDGEVLLTNTSQYVMSGIAVAIAVFDNTSDVMPAYWAVVAEDVLLAPESQNTVAFSLDPSAMPAGSYTIQPFAIQGGWADLLGVVLQGDPDAASYDVIKSASAAVDINISLTVNGQIGGQVSLQQSAPVTATAKVENGSVELLSDLNTLMVVTRGTAPLGAAVVAEKIDSYSLVPNLHRYTDVDYLEGVIDYNHSIHAAVVSSERLLPMTSTKIIIEVGAGIEGEEESVDGVWPYVSQVGVRNLNVAGGEVVACVGYAGLQEQPTELLDLLGVELMLEAEGIELYAKKIDSSMSGVDKYFKFTPEKLMNPDTILLNLHTLDNRVSVPAGDAVSMTNAMAQQLTLADELQVSYQCPVEGGCGEEVVQKNEEVVPVTPPASDPVNWNMLYGLVAIGGLLLLVFFGRRMMSSISDPQTLTKDELQ
jgi:hypothetical protein